MRSLNTLAHPDSGGKISLLFCFVNSATWSSNLNRILFSQTYHLVAGLACLGEGQPVFGLKKKGRWGGEERRGEEVRKFHLETGEEVFKEDVLPGQLSQQRLAPVLLHQLAVYRSYWVPPLLIAAQYSFPFQPSMMTALLSSLSAVFLLHLTCLVPPLIWSFTFYHYGSKRATSL